MTLRELLKWAEKFQFNRLRRIQPKGLKIKDSKIAKKAIKRLIEENQEVFDALAKGRSEE